MTREQTYRLEKAVENIEDALRLKDEDNSRIMSICLNVAGNYCKEVAGEIKELMP